MGRVQHFLPANAYLQSNTALAPTVFSVETDPLSGQPRQIGSKSLFRTERTLAAGITPQGEKK